MTNPTIPNPTPKPIRRIVILSDVHGNLPALEAVIEDAEKRQGDLFWNLGDFLGYGPFVNEVVDVLFDRCTAQVIGNYDLKVLKFPEKKDKWRKSKSTDKFLAFQWAWENLSRVNAKRLAALPKKTTETVGDYEILLTHAGPDRINEIIGTSTPWERLSELIKMTSANIILCGHTHVPFQKEFEGVTFLNPGSVGRPEGNDPRACYAMLNVYADSFAVHFYRVEYDIERMTRAIHAAGLPNDFSEMFRTGQNLDQVQDCEADTEVEEIDLEACIEKVRRFAIGCQYEAEHSEQVTKLAEILFDRLQSIHTYGKEERFLLTCAGILHDIGWLQGPQGHHKAAMEMILADSAMPLSSRQRNIIAAIARYHRKALPKENHPVYQRLASKDREKVRMLAGILRIADGLDRSHMSCITDIEINKKTDSLELRCKAKGIAECEMAAGIKKSDLLSQVLSTDIKLQCC